MTRVLIAVIGSTGNEAEALRQSLEGFGYFVGICYIGRPNDLIRLLQGDMPFRADYLVLSCHGENGAVLMPQLADSVYLQEEPRCNFSADLIRNFCIFENITVINLGCTTGSAEMADAFGTKNTYIAPHDYVTGSGALMFALRFFYEMSKDTMSISDAFAIASDTDEETRLFHMY